MRLHKRVGIGGAPTTSPPSPPSHHLMSHSSSPCWADTGVNLMKKMICLLLPPLAHMLHLSTHKQTRLPRQLPLKRRLTCWLHSCRDCATVPQPAHEAAPQPAVRSSRTSGVLCPCMAGSQVGGRQHQCCTPHTQLPLHLQVPAEALPCTAHKHMRVSPPYIQPQVVQALQASQPHHPARPSTEQFVGKGRLRQSLQGSCKPNTVGKGSLRARPCGDCPPSHHNINCNSRRNNNSRNSNNVTNSAHSRQEGWWLPLRQF